MARSGAAARIAAMRAQRRAVLWATRALWLRDTGPYAALWCVVLVPPMALWLAGAALPPVRVLAVWWLVAPLLALWVGPLLKERARGHDAE